MLLGEINLDAAKVGAVAAEDDLAVNVDVLRGELIEIFEAAVVSVDGLGGDIAGARRAVVGHDDARIVLIGIAIHMLAVGAGHEQMAGLVPGLDADDFRIVEEHAIGNDLRVEPGGAELARDELRGFVVLGRCGEMRLRGESLEVLAGQFGIGHGEELRFQFCFRVEVGIAEAALRDNLREGWKRRQSSGKAVPARALQLKCVNSSIRHAPLSASILLVRWCNKRAEKKQPQIPCELRLRSAGSTCAADGLRSG